jgi:hypothetical protein
LVRFGNIGVHRQLKASIESTRILHQREGDAGVSRVRFEFGAPVMRLAIIVVAAFALASCHRIDPEAATLNRDSPFGFWSTERGQTIEVRRDGTYTYCDQGVCASGRTRPDPPTMIWLVDFNKMPLTNGLRELSDENWRLRADPTVQAEADYQLGDAVSDEFRRKRCRGRPCAPVGRVTYDVYRFVKLRDY